MSSVFKWHYVYDDVANTDDSWIECRPCSWTSSVWKCPVGDDRMVVALAMLFAQEGHTGTCSRAQAAWVGPRLSATQLTAALGGGR